MANFTEREIKRSFIKLLNEKPLSKISVRDIVEDCGINRNSFYYHFQDIPALLEEIVSEQSAAIIQKYPQPDSLEECFRAAFEFALRHLLWKTALLIGRPYDRTACILCGTGNHRYGQSPLCRAFGLLG